MATLPSVMHQVESGALDMGLSLFFKHLPASGEYHSARFF